MGAGRDLLRADLPLKSHERVFFERVPLPREARERVRPSDPWDFGRLAENVEAWGWRWCQEHARLSTGGSWRGAGTRRSTCPW